MAYKKENKTEKSNDSRPKKYHCRMSFESYKLDKYRNIIVEAFCKSPHQARLLDAF
jgi:hypothetical protein